MKNIIVLGIGNRLMMDDGIGIYLVERLSKLNYTENITFLAGESDIDYCLAQIEGSSLVIILDAVCSGETPGDLTIYPLSVLHEVKSLDISPHNLHLFQALYYQREKINGYLIGVEPYEIRFHIGLSEPLKKKWDFILHAVTKSIEKIIQL